MYKKILVPTDGSDRARLAGEQAISIATQFDATLSALYVVDERAFRMAGGNLTAATEPTGVDADVPSEETAVRERGEEAIETIRTLAKEATLDFESDVVLGIPSEAILEYADETDVDLIVMGTHGRTGFKRYVLGSVTERVVRLSDVPVLTVRSPVE